ncbi:GNAT family N-acetyltransferase [Longispora albida]|uniref:GNAT family N-acetyltransferase n=1 Tax=Longispora albida TaxID=203523 RepID=UPI0003733401|nr:GNAT family N-acetyltransferase [Longispora albida]
MPAGTHSEIRAARAGDLPELALICAEHAAYERAPAVPSDLAVRLGEALFGQRPRLFCLIAAEGDRLIGYATYTVDYSTWAGREYTHLDCLFVREGQRGSGLGLRLLRAVAAGAHDELQWQTPQWNDGAQRFYERLGARPSAKVRYTLAASQLGEEQAQGPRKGVNSPSNY